MGPTVWMMYFAGSRYPFVIFASPVRHPPSVRHSSSNSGPAARCIAPSTPPPPSKLRFAALTMASQCRVVMSAQITCVFFIWSHFLRSLMYGLSIFPNRAKRDMIDPFVLPRTLIISLFERPSSNIAISCRSSSFVHGFPAFSGGFLGWSGFFASSSSNTQ